MSDSEQKGSSLSPALGNNSASSNPKDVITVESEAKSAPSVQSSTEVPLPADTDPNDSFESASGALLSSSPKPDKNFTSSTTRVRLPGASSKLELARMATSLEDITSFRLWKGIIAEFVGTLLLTLVGCGSCIDLNPLPLNSTRTVPELALLVKPTPVVQIALCFGLSVATIVWSIGHISGGHINPAVTAALLATRKISLVKGGFFIIFQLIGAIVGAGILHGMVPDGYHGSLGATMVSKHVSPGQGMVVELFITFVLIFVIFASCDSKRQDLRGSTPLTIGLAVTMCHLFAIEFTGSSMNTARSFGPAVVMGIWSDHWVYWVGPILGGVLAGLFYDNLFAVNASLAKAKACILTSDYDDEKFKAHKLKVRIIEEDELEGDHRGDEIVLKERNADQSPPKF